MKTVLTAVASVAILIVFLIIVFTLSSSWDAIGDVGILDFLFGTQWSPSSGAYGAAAIILGTLLVTLGAIAFAIPLGIGAAIYISEVANPKARNTLKLVCEIFAGIPFAEIGETNTGNSLEFVSAAGKVDLPLEEMVASYKATLAGV